MEASQLFAQNENGSLPVDRLQPRSQPLAYGVSMTVEETRNLFHRIRPIELRAAGIDPAPLHRYPLKRSIRFLMSSTFQAVVRGPSFTGFGNRPALTPAHQVERPTGIGPLGARMEGSRTKPVSGNDFCCNEASKDAKPVP
jgi:hypothetical protein